MSFPTPYRHPTNTVPHRHQPTLYESARQVLADAGTFLRGCYRDTTQALRLSIVCSAAFLIVVAATLPHLGCATTPKGIANEKAMYSAATNTVATAQSIVPYIPAPFATPVEVVLGAASALLGAWNLHQQKSIKALKNGNGKTTPQTPPPAACASPPAAS